MKMTFRKAASFLLAALLLLGALSSCAPENETEATRTTRKPADATSEADTSAPDDASDDAALPKEASVMKLSLTEADGIPVYVYGEKGTPGYEEADYTSLYAEWGRDVTIADVREDPDTGLAYIIRGKRLTLGLDFLSKAMIYNTEPSGAYPTEDDVYVAWWRWYVTRWNYLLPEIPLCEESSAMLYRIEISGPDVLPVTAERTLARALLYWQTKKESSTVSIAVLEDIDGLFRYPSFKKDTAAAPDLMVEELTNGLEIVAISDDGRPEWNPTVVHSHEETENEDGSRTYTIHLWEDLRFSDGSQVTARDYLAFPLAFLSAPGAEADPSFQERSGLHFSGVDTFRFYEGGDPGKGVLSGVRLLDDYTFSLTVPASELPDANLLFSLRLTAQYAPMWLGGAEILDDGEGCYLSEDFYEKTADRGFLMAEHLRKSAEDPESLSLYPYSGPYALLHFSSGDTASAVLGKNTYYRGNMRGQKPSIETLVVKQVPEEDVYEQLLQGTTDILADIKSPERLKKASEIAFQPEGMVKAAWYGLGKTEVLHFRADLGPVQFEEVRKALALLLDRETLKNNLAGGLGIVPDGPYTDNALYRTAVLSGMRLQSYKMNTARACLLLEEGGWVYDSKGMPYESGVRYKKIPAELMDERNRAYASADGAAQTFEKDGYYYMPLAINLFALEDTELSEKLSLLLKDKTFSAAGFLITETEGSFAQAMDELTESSISGYYTGTPLMNAFDALTRDYGGTDADGSYKWTLDPEEYELFSECFFRDPADVVWLK